MVIDNKVFDIGKRTYIMGILNLTPDSFSDGGSYRSTEEAVKRAKEMARQGADMIDVGGESTRPDHTPVSESEEMERVIPVIAALKSEINVPVSIDTMKASVAEAAIKKGASVINDVWGFKKDVKMAEVAARYGVACCLMHNRENKNTAQGNEWYVENKQEDKQCPGKTFQYDDFIDGMLAEIAESIEIALKAGVKKENIMIDPGIGFAKTHEQNLAVMKNLKVFKTLGYPVLLGTSRKSLIGNVLNLPPDQRMEGTIVTTALGIFQGCDFVRVHDVLENKKACVMADAIVRECGVSLQYG